MNASLSPTPGETFEPADGTAGESSGLTFEQAANRTAEPADSTGGTPGPRFTHGVLVAGTPLGNIADASPRLREALAAADVIAAEDTRRTRALAAALNVTIRGRVVSNFDHNEESRLEWLLNAARHGIVLLVTDAGMPIVSDPGHVLVDAALSAGLPVSVVPGPSAVPTALALCGLAAGRFAFDGFAPRKAGPRRAWLETLVTETRTVVFFESPHRLADTLAVAAEVLGPERRAAVCREMTKTYEEVRRGTLPELAEWARDGARGEITVVIEGGDGHPRVLDREELVATALRRAEAGERLKSVVKDLAKQYGLPTRELYDAAISARG